MSTNMYNTKGIYLVNAGGDMATAAAAVAKNESGEGYEVGLYAPIVWGSDNVLESSVGRARAMANLEQDASSLATYFYPDMAPISEQAASMQQGVDVRMVASDAALVALMRDVLVVLGADAPKTVLTMYRDGRCVREYDLIRMLGDERWLVVAAGEDAAETSERLARSLREEGLAPSGVILTGLDERDEVMMALVAAAAAAPLVAVVGRDGEATFLAETV